MTTFAARLTAAKSRLGLSDARLADLIASRLSRHGLGKTSRTQIQRWRHGKHAPAVPVRAVVLEFLSRQGA